MERKSFTAVEQKQMKKHGHTVRQGEGEANSDDLFKGLLISFVNTVGFFPRSIFNQYTVMNFKWCLGGRCTSILLETVRSQPGVNYVAHKVKICLSSVSGFLPWFSFIFLTAFPLPHSLHLSSTRSCMTIYRGWFPQLQVINCL